jgi:hypothetical protein
MEQPGHRVGLTPAVSANNSSPEIVFQAIIRLLRASLTAICFE